MPKLNFLYGYERCVFLGLLLLRADTLENPIEDVNPSAHDWAAIDKCNMAVRFPDVLQDTDPLNGG